MVSVLLRHLFQGLVFKGQLQGTQRNTSKWCRFFSGNLFKGWFTRDSFKEHNGTLQNGVGSCQATFSRVGFEGTASMNITEHFKMVSVGVEGTASRNTMEHSKMVSVLLRQPFQGLVFKGQLQGTQRNTPKWCLFFSGNLFKGWFTRDSFKEHNGTLQNGVCSSQAPLSRVGLKGTAFKKHNGTLENGVCFCQAPFSRVGLQGTASIARNTTEHFKMVSVLLRHPFQGLVLKGQLQGTQRNTSKWCRFFSGNLFKGWFSRDSFKEHNGTLQNGVCSSQATFSRVGFQGTAFKKHHGTLQNGVCSSQATFSRVGFKGTASRTTTEHFNMVFVLLRQPFQGLVLKGQLQ